MDHCERDVDIDAEGGGVGGGGKLHVLLCCTGSVACVKVPALVESLWRRAAGRVVVRVACTDSAAHFLQLQSLEAMLADQQLQQLPVTPPAAAAAAAASGEVKSRSQWKTESLDLTGASVNIESCSTPPTAVMAEREEEEAARAGAAVARPAAAWQRQFVFRDADEWRLWRERGDPVLHIELRRWAHLLLVAPLSANTLARLATGLADSLVACVARAWPHRRKPLLLCPAMNTDMWHHPCTGQQLQLLRSWGCHVQPPVVKRLVCGDWGVGAMADPADISDTVMRLLTSPPPPAAADPPPAAAACSESSYDT